MQYIGKIFNSIFWLWAYSFFCYTAFAKTEFKWPVKYIDLTDKLTSLFGESRSDHFHNGIDIASVNQPVLSIGDGQIIYSSYTEDRPFENPHGPGNSVWIYHGDGILSAYYHLKDGRNNTIQSKKTVKMNEEIGISGNTGHSGGAHLHFLVVDQFGRRIIDPLSILAPIKDTVPPEITNLFIHVGDRFTLVNEGEYINLSSNWPVTIKIRDAGEKKFQNRGIRNIKYFVNGIMYKKASFAILNFKNGNWVNPENYNFDQLYLKDDYLVGSLGLKSGENSIKVIAEDYSGNIAERTFTFYVNRTN